MANLSPTENGNVSRTQDHLKDAKEALRGIDKEMRQMAKENREAGRAIEANACGRLRGVALECLGILEQGHMDASDSLNAGYDDGGPIILGGGGGR